MQAGRLDRRIIIQQKTVTFDSFGDETESWTELSTVWANVIVKSGRESFNNDQEIAERTVIFRIRYLSTVTERMRISYNSVFYDIESIKELGRREGMEISTTVNNPV